MSVIPKSFILTILTIFSIDAYSASFNCDLAKTIIEKHICSTSELSHLDKWLNNSYRQHYKYKDDAGKKAYKKKQLAWLKARDKSCTISGGLSECLEGMYKERIKQLEENNNYLRDDIATSAPRVLQILRDSNQFSLKKPPRYLKLSDTKYLVAIDWGQGGRIQLGFYLVDINTRALNKVIGGYPSFDGIFIDSDRTVIVSINTTHHRGLGSKEIGAIELWNGRVTRHSVALVSYYAPDGEPEDVCQPGDPNLAPLSFIEQVQRIHIKDMNNDGYRDISVKIRSVDCGTRKITNRNAQLISTNEETLNN